MKKKVFVSGHFNVLHPGHLRFLKFAKECGDYLVVGVESNKIARNAAYVDEKTRLNSIKSVSLVDEAFILRTSPSVFIKRKKPLIVVKGKEYENQTNDEFKILDWYIQLYALYKVEGMVVNEVPTLERMLKLTDKLIGKRSDDYKRVAKVLAETYCKQEMYYEFYTFVKKRRLKISCRN